MSEQLGSDSVWVDDAGEGAPVRCRPPASNVLVGVSGPCVKREMFGVNVLFILNVLLYYQDCVVLVSMKILKILNSGCVDPCEHEYFERPGVNIFLTCLEYKSTNNIDDLK